MLAGHTTARDASRCMDTNQHKRSQPSQQRPARSQQSRTCWTFARPVPQYAVTVIYRNQQHKKQKRFSVLRKKKGKAKNKKNNDDFRKVVISDWIPDALRDLHGSKYQRPRNKPNTRWLPMETGKAQQRLREQTTPICCDHWNIYWKPGLMMMEQVVSGAKYSGVNCTIE